MIRAGWRVDIEFRKTVARQGNAVRRIDSSVTIVHVVT